MAITLSRESPIPLHKQLLNEVRHRILSGQWLPDTRIPSELELKQQLGLSRSTVRQALLAAQAEGLLERVAGKGTFVAHVSVPAGNPQLIGFVIPYFRSSFDSQLLRGAESAAKARGYRIIFCNSERKVEEEDRLLQLLVRDGVTGVVIWPAMGEGANRFLLHLARQLAVTLMDRTFPGLGADFVRCDNYAGAYTATQHLISLGHRQPAFLARPYLELLPIAQRLEGYRAAMQDAGLSPLEPILVGEPREIGTDYALRAYLDASGEDIQQIRRHLESAGRPTAIFAMNDLMAMQVLKAASLAGVRVPQDLSIVGFDDLDVVSQLEVPLTTVVQDPFALGDQATRLLVDRIEGRADGPREVVLPTRLIVRASTGPPAS